MEAYIGAIFVDSEYNYGEVERFFEAHIRWFFEDMSIYDTFANNHPTVRSPKQFFLTPNQLSFPRVTIYMFFTLLRNISFFKKKT